MTVVLLPERVLPSCNHLSLSCVKHSEGLVRASKNRKAVFLTFDVPNVRHRCERNEDKCDLPYLNG